MHGVWTAANRLSTGGLTGIVGKATIAANSVGAGLLAKVVNDDVRFLDERGALGLFASKLAPTRV